MGPPRRTRDNPIIPSHGSNIIPLLSASKRLQRTQKPSSSLPNEPNLGMTPASRYNHNLKVLRRRDPSIVSIFDQFSHVCVYHHNGKKWEKQGFEGSMFLYERESYPPYGFYILNRMGMDDYIQRLYPEDDIGAHGSYLMMRSYPEFTSRRLASIHSTEKPHKFADIYAVSTPERLKAKDKGCSQTVGLWMFATDAREPMIDVMLRLHSFIKRNIPYPEEFRYGPERPPPPNPHLRTTRSDDDPFTSDADVGLPQSSKPDHLSTNHPSKAYANGGISELDKLFAKLSPAPSAQLPSASSTSNMTVESLFAALGGNEIVSSTTCDNDLALDAEHTSPSPSPTSRGLALLDSIFASATPSPSNATATATSSPHTPPTRHISSPNTSLAYVGTQVLQNGNAVISSPAPSTVLQPQVLNENVISTLLGLGHGPSPLSFLPASHSHTSHTRSSSRSSQSDALSGLQSHPSLPHSFSRHLHPHPHSHSRASSGTASRYSGDNEGSDESASGYSESSTVLDPDADPSLEQQTAGAPAGQPPLSMFALESDISRVDLLGDEQGEGVEGDVTPRAGLRAIWGVNGGRVASKTSTPVTVGAMLSPRKRLSQSHLLTPSGSASRLHVTTSPLMDAVKSSASPLQLPPFPTPPPPRPVMPFEADSEIWPYPRAPLDDRPIGDDNDILELDFADTSALSDPEVFKSKMMEKGKGKGKGEEFVKTNSGEGASRNVVEEVNGEGTGKKKETKVSEGTAEILPAALSQAQTRGPTLPPLPGPEPHSNGIRKVRATAHDGVLDRDVASKSIVTAVLSSPSAQKLPATLERNEFVREVLTLIHTDRSFVDGLWRDYMAKFHTASSTDTHL